MKVLQLGKFFPIRGGVEKVMYDLMISLSEKTIACDMLCASDINDKKEKTIKINDFSNIFIEPSLKEIAKTKISFQLVAKLKKNCNNYNIIHIHHPDPMAALALWFSGYKGKVILHWHSDILAQKKLLKLYHPLQEWLLKRSNLILTTSPDYLRFSVPLEKYISKSQVLPIGIKDISQSYDKDTVNVIKNKYKNRKIIFSVGRLVEYKGFQYLINSAKYLTEEYIILIGGTGPLKNELQNIIDNNHLNEKVHLLGYLDDKDLYSYFKASDLFCLSSIEKTEAFAIVQIEAMAFGKPIVATEIVGSGVPWVNQNFYSGVNVKPKNSEALSVGIKNITMDFSVYNTYSINARKRYLDNFTIEKVVDDLEKIYKQVLNS